MNEQIKAGADIHSRDDAGYSVGTQEECEKFAKARNKSRIQKLAEQAGFRSDVTVSDGLGNYITTKTQQSLNAFAELIIQECMDIALDKKKWVEDQVVFDPRDQAWNKARIQQSQHIVDKIKQHFGVEE